MTIYLMRHGKSLGNENPLAYGEMGDAQVPLVKEGWLQVIAAGQFLAPYLKAEGMTKWPRLWASSYVRPQESLSGLLHGMDGLHGFSDKAEVFENDNLIEQSFGLLPYLLDTSRYADLEVFPPERVQEFSKLMTAFSKLTYGHTKFTAQPPLGESPQMLTARVRDFVSTLRRDIDVGMKDHFVATHGAVIKAIMKESFHLPMAAWDKLKTPGNADIFRIDMDPKTNRLMGITQIWDGEAMKPVNINPLANIRPTRLSDLPQVPADLRLTLGGS